MVFMNIKNKLKLDNLVTDKIPVFLIERVVLKVENNCVVGIKKDAKKVIPTRQIHLLCLGNGVSFTSDVANLCAKHNCFISFTKGGLNNHSYWNLGKYKDPKPTIFQSLCQFDSEKRLHIAKYMFDKRLKYVDPDLHPNLDNKLNIESIIGCEGNMMRSIYSRNLPDGILRKERDLRINKCISLQNHLLYNFISTLILSYGFNPNIGILHGKTRRGAFSFDIADIFKVPLILKHIKKQDLESNPLRSLSKRLMENNNKWVKEIMVALRDIKDEMYNCIYK